MTTRPRRTVTRTYALLPVSRAAYDEIRGKLLDAEHQHCMYDRSSDPHDPPMIDLDGLALVAEDSGDDVGQRSDPEAAPPVREEGAAAEAHHGPGAAPERPA